VQRNIDNEVRRAITLQLVVSALLTLVGLVLDLVALVEVPSLFRNGGVVGGIFLILFAIGLPWYGIWNFRRNMRWRSNLDEHPAFVCPAFGAPSQVRQALQHVLNAPGAVKVGKVLVTADWMLQSTAWNVQSVYLPTVAWCYKHVTSHKYYGVITVRKTYAYHAWTVEGKQVNYSEIPQKQVDQLLALTAERVPWAICGHTPEAQQLWTSNRDKFLQSVAYRRQCLTQPAQSGQTPPHAC
jgi:hypothetical protein